MSIPKRKRRGAATVEFALIVPIMLTFTFGLIEISRISLFKESMTQATREGARLGIKPSATTEEVTARVNQELEILGIGGATVTLEPSSLGQAGPGESIRVHVSVPVNEASWVGGYFSFGGSDIVAETVMRRESTD